jgi:lactate permease
MPEIWLQNYNPTGSVWLSTCLAALPVVVLLGLIAFLKVRIHVSALLGLVVAILLALKIYGMPWRAAGAAAVYGAGFGLFPIGWIILNVLFLYQLTVRRGLFDVLRESLARIAPDPRIQIILIAFSFGAFIEGIAGFGTPVAITGAILIQMGFKPLHASGLALIANTAPVAFGSVGIPITTLEQVTGLDAIKLSAMVGRQLPFFSLIIPFWVVAAYDGFRGVRAVWPAALTAGAAFAVPQFLISNLHGPWLVDTLSAVCSIAAVVLLLRVWKPRNSERSAGLPDAQQPRLQPELSLSSTPASTGAGAAGRDVPPSVSTEAQSGSNNEDQSLLTSAATRTGRPGTVFQAWIPWAILTCFILLWGTPAVKRKLDSIFSPKIPAPFLNNQIQRAPPVVPENAKPEKAEFNLNLLSATGTAILFAAIVAGLTMGHAPAHMARIYIDTIWRVRFSLLTIAAMLALGNVTKFSGADATLGLALAHTGRLYPFFGTLLGWLGVALTGSDTASNVLFGSLQKITAEHQGISPILMGAANSSGGVMGKMIDAQSIVVASTATNWYGHEGSVLRFVFLHSLILAVLVGVLVFLQAYVFPFTLMVVG